MADNPTNFLGIPITGDITSPNARAVQRPLSEFQPLIQAILDDPTIRTFGWRQYTPYFNDGDPCVFSAYGAWYLTIEDGQSDSDDADDDFERYELEFDEHPSLGKLVGGTWQRDNTLGHNVKVGAVYEGPDEARFIRCKSFADAIESGAFDDVLIHAFGDHANITVHADHIDIEFYDHD